MPELPELDPVIHGKLRRALLSLLFRVTWRERMASTSRISPDSISGRGAILYRPLVGMRRR
jgi:hypothetical protein